jgi:hypothetical protein
VLLHRPIVRPFLQMLVARCEKMTVGDGLPENSETGLEFFVDRKAVYVRG